VYHDRLLGVWALVAALGGCLPEFPSVNAACADSVPGEADGSAAAVEAIGRMNCYRRYEQLYDGRINAEAQAAAVSHLDYLVDNDVITGTVNDFTEEASLPGFTGVHLVDRLDTQGYVYFDETQIGVWEGLFTITGETRSAVDLLMHDPYMRDGLLQPSWEGAGYHQRTHEASDVTLGYFNIAYRFPSYARLERPVVYPRDGQTGVPTSYSAFNEFNDPELDFQTVGYPISITVGSTEDVGSGDNPYYLSAVASAYTEQGDYVALKMAPVFNATAVLVPTKPLPANTRVDLTATVTWSCCQVEVEASFWTGDVFDPWVDIPTVPFPPPVGGSDPRTQRDVRGGLFGGLPHTHRPRVQIADERPVEADVAASG